MATFYQANVTATNGSAFVTVNSSTDDIGILRERSFLQVGTNRIVEVKRGIAGSPAQIELADAWPFATVTADAIAGPTAGDLAEAVEQIRSLNSQAGTILADALLKADNLAGLQSASAARGNLELGDAATRSVMSSLTDTTSDLLMVNGAHGLGRGILFGGDIDDLTESSATYRLQSGATTTTGDVSPSAGDILKVDRWDGNTGYQRLYKRGPMRTLERSRDGGVWEPFREVYNQNRILSPVSQSGGVPTGGLFYWDENASGASLSLPDGTIFLSGELEFDFNNVSVQVAPLPASVVSGSLSGVGWAFENGAVNGETDHRLHLVACRVGDTTLGFQVRYEETGSTSVAETLKIFWSARARWF